MSQSNTRARPLKVKTVEQVAGARGQRSHSVEVQVGATTLQLQCKNGLHAQVVTDALSQCASALVTSGTLAGRLQSFADEFLAGSAKADEGRALMHEAAEALGGA